MTALPPDLVGELFRHRCARLVAGLCGVLGPSRLDLAEDVVQEALLRALRSWPAEGVPDNPEAWLFRVARNLALDSLRRQRIGARIDAELQQWARREEPPTPPPEGIADDALRILFVCSHPAVPPDARVALILKTACGFGVPAIARALLAKEATIAQRLVRAKAKLQAADVVFEVPAPHELASRLDLVLQAIYLLFNEGYRRHAGDELLAEDLVEDAVRLLALVLQQPSLATPPAHALMASLLFIGARTAARVDAAGDLVPLAQQDRSKWNGAWIACGFHHLRASLAGDALTPFHCEAAIASLHAVATSYASTDWTRILAEYDRLLDLAPSPIVRLNRAVAVGKVHGAGAGLAALADLDDDEALADYFLLGAVRAQLHWERSDFAAAAVALQQALAQPCTAPERRLLERRLAACRVGEAPPPW
jgi:RNA polymerase sigma-70 factor (ECF subfamily)